MEKVVKKRGRRAMRKGELTPAQRQARLNSLQKAREGTAKRKEERKANAITPSPINQKGGINSTVSEIREKRVLQLLSAGFNHMEIADLLQVTKTTVLKHISSLKQSFGRIDTNSLISIHAGQFLKIAISYDLFVRDLLQEYIRVKTALEQLDSLPSTTSILTNSLSISIKSNNNKQCGYVDKVVNSLLLRDKLPVKGVDNCVDKVFIRPVLTRELVRLGKEIASQNKNYVETIDKMGVPRILSHDDDIEPTHSSTELELVESEYVEKSSEELVLDGRESAERLAQWWGEKVVGVVGRVEGGKGRGEAEMLPGDPEVESEDGEGPHDES